ncbi:MAG: hypothetical protein M3Y17_05110 [Actinomycetota bacterium]|nr:hypothetical protein [Actinomycetota bacterium]
MSDDPLDDLLGQLLKAHDKLKDIPSRHDHDDGPAAAHGPNRAARVGRRQRRLAILLIAGFLASISTAAAIIVETRSSAPLSGRLPRDLLGTRYELEIGPDLVAGALAWCTTLVELGSSGASLSLGPGHCDTPQGAVIAQGGLVALSARTGAVTGSLLYAVVDRRVAALRTLVGTRVIPIHVPQLPDDWSAAVTIQSNPKPQVPSAMATLSPLGPQDTPLRSAAARAPAEATQLPVRPVNPLRPPSHGCAIDAKAVPGIRVGHALALRSPAPTRLATAQPGLLSCYTLTFYAHGQSGVAAILLDVRHPGRQPDPLPSTRPLPHEEGVVTGSGAEDLGFGFVARGQLVAERIHHGWLVVQTATIAPSQAILRYLHARV